MMTLCLVILFLAFISAILTSDTWRDVMYATPMFFFAIAGIIIVSLFYVIKYLVSTVCDKAAPYFRT